MTDVLFRNENEEKAQHNIIEIIQEDNFQNNKIEENKNEDIRNVQPAE